ncbi:hypothetical protein EVAR_88358_1 [Eumeta japonica]|uniref:Uncharacterized protein n=1 Tax=Eumeta variegata TaxID=151549 RepID=A0A4C1XCG6_EUMVA|nr:hypothetical protein EVAR_88358_1 [Eumeta japonica]
MFLRVNTNGSGFRPPIGRGDPWEICGVVRARARRRAPPQRKAGEILRRGAMSNRREMNTWKTIIIKIIHTNESLYFGTINVLFMCYRHSAPVACAAGPRYVWSLEAVSSSLSVVHYPPHFGHSTLIRVYGTRKTPERFKAAGVH